MSDREMMDEIMRIRRIQSGMSADERVTLWDEIRSGYCAHCGIELASPGCVCHCDNDE